MLAPTEGWMRMAAHSSGVRGPALRNIASSTAIFPTRFTVSTEDYLLARRLYMYVPSSALSIVKSFAEFTISHQGKEMVEKSGLISQNIKLEKSYKVGNAPKKYNEYTEMASRLSVNFRFTSGSNELDNKAKRDLSRLLHFMEINPGRRVVLMGFSDITGVPEKNKSLSLLRAHVLEKELTARGINVTAVEGFGAELPIASNSTKLGRSRNRRVEVWVF